MRRYTSSLLAAVAIAATIQGTTTQGARAAAEPFLSEIMFIGGLYCPLG